MIMILANHLRSCLLKAPFLIRESRLLLCANNNFCEKYFEAKFQRRYHSEEKKEIIKKMLGSVNLKKFGIKGNLDLKDLDDLDISKKNFTVSIEGNIGCGKTTLLEYYRNSPNVEAIPEPVEQWTNVKGHNALELLYKDPKRWSFSFNMYAQLTRIKMHQHQQIKPIKMLERSLYSTQYCFVENDYRNGTLNGLEHSIITEWFNWLIESQQVTVDLIVYLRADPEVCHQRIKQRSRKEESGVPYKLIEELHELHEDWLIHQTSYKTPAPVLVVDANNNYDVMKSIYEDKRPEILCGYC
ncbi:deoxynucleoside kinase [Patella vulgata]|uniref:deoxynucleoside kinase n=1 Tax=Patella vulgata TaxID=6465 RepID=UPI00217FFCD1|nr:deoxynucleoside kinase [Patella vulgata]